ncbi:MAG: polymer-forming cytoskeletal protein [Hyphomicrobiaceae bacterium]
MAIIAKDMVLKGEIRNCRRLEVHGYLEGNVSTELLLVHTDGKVFGTVKADNAEIHGSLQGTVRVRNLISIASDGSVVGSIQYGQLALASGGELSAEVRNVPPEIAGDLNLVVRRGRSVRVAAGDLTAVDPDDGAQSLTFSTSNIVGGFLAMAAAPDTAVTTFTQADIEAGNVFFVHDGSPGARAGFDVVVADAKGATSGGAQSVTVDVIA